MSGFPLSIVHAECWLQRLRNTPFIAAGTIRSSPLQSHGDHMRALAEATRLAVREAGINGDQVEAIALDTTDSTVIPVDENLCSTRRALPLV